MKPLAEWTDAELRELHLSPAFLGFTAEESLDELLRRARDDMRRVCREAVMRYLWECRQDGNNSWPQESAALDIADRIARLP